MARVALSSVLAACLLGLAPSLVASDLSAALRRSASRAPAALPADAPLSGSVVIPLQRVGPRRHEGAEGASFYVGTVSVGHPPQELQVLFDTSSGHVLLPHRACKSAACIEHRRYSPWESSTAMDMNFNGSQVQPGHRLARGAVRRDAVTLGYTQSDLGEGDAKSVLVRDTLCVGGAQSGGQACVDLGVLAALSLQDVPFRAMPNDGIIGLGLEALAAGPLCSFLGRLLEGSRNVLPQFGINFGAESGELHLGGHDASRLAAPLQWFPVDHPEDGYWQVAIQAVRVGNVTVDDCSEGCHGIVDTGVSRLGVQTSHLGRLQASLSSALSEDGRCHGPTLIFDLEGMLLTLGPEDYTGGDCTPQLGPLALEEPQFTGVYAFGETVLRRYYAAFDWEKRKLGFAPLAGAGASGTSSSGEPAAAAGSLDEPPKADAESPTLVVV